LSAYTATKTAAEEKLKTDKAAELAIIDAELKTFKDASNALQTESDALKVEAETAKNASDDLLTQAKNTTDEAARATILTNYEAQKKVTIEKVVQATQKEAKAKSELEKISQKEEADKNLAI